MKFRLYRKITRVEYKDLEVNSEAEAVKQRASGKEGWTVTDDGLITDTLVSGDSSRERGNDIFIEREVAYNQVFKELD